MDSNRYLEDAHSLKEFVSLYCSHKHHRNQQKPVIQIFQHNGVLYGKSEVYLCDQCKEIFLYAHERLSSCEKSLKPKCRNCKDRCYDKKHWRDMAKIMRYSGIYLGYNNIKNKIKNLTNKILT